MNRLIKTKTFDDAYILLCTDLIENPDYVITNKEGHKLHELLKPTIALIEPEACLALSRDMSLKYLIGELKFYLSGSPYLKDIQQYSSFWNRVSDDNLTINSNYGRLLLHDRNVNNLTQFEYAKHCLEKNPESKKAVMIIYDKNHSRKSKDNPCTMYLQFFIREGKLILFVNMRSSDIWFGMPYDVPFFVYILKKMSQELFVPIGEYIHTSGSLHAYERNFAVIEEVIKREPSSAEEQKMIFSRCLDSTLKEN